MVPCAETRFKEEILMKQYKISNEYSFYVNKNGNNVFCRKWKIKKDTLYHKGLIFPISTPLEDIISIESYVDEGFPDNNSLEVSYNDVKSNGEKFINKNVLHFSPFDRKDIEKLFRELKKAYPKMKLKLLSEKDDREMCDLAVKDLTERRARAKEEEEDRRTAQILAAQNASHTTKKDASVVGRAVVGGLVAGPAGAVVGALSAVDKNNKNRSK